MEMRAILDQAKRYVLERSCPSGGFCHYRLDEPNVRDTYYALASLRIVDVPYQDEKTFHFLRTFQNADGSYDTLAWAYFTLLSLELLGESPRHDPEKSVAALTEKLTASYLRQTASSELLFHNLHRVVALHHALRLAFDERVGDEIAALVRPYLQPDGGFGMDGSSLEETRLAVAVLRGIGRPPVPGDVEPFLRSCEHPVFGFTGKPGSSLFYLEYNHAGLALSDLLGVAPKYGAACANFVRRCQISTGGFARASIGIATLENTFLALHSFEILRKL